MLKNQRLLWSLWSTGWRRGGWTGASDATLSLRGWHPSPAQPSRRRRDWRVKQNKQEPGWAKARATLSGVVADRGLRWTWPSSGSSLWTKPCRVPTTALWTAQQAHL